MSNQTRIDGLAQLVETWRTIGDFDALHYPDRLAPGMPRFIDYAWEHFDAKKVITVLLSQQKTYKALKPILFSGLCTWMMCPGENWLRQNGMLLVGIQHLRWAEAMGRAAVADRGITDHELLGDIIGRLRGLGPDFYRDFYYPVGGLTELLRSTTPVQFENSLLEHTADVPIFVAMMQVFDFHAKHFTDRKKCYPASISKGIEIVREIYGRDRKNFGIDLGNIEKTWKKYRNNGAIIYAATTISSIEGTNLLGEICAGTATYEKYGHLLPTWIRRSRYAAQAILGNSTKLKVGSENAAQLPDIASEETPEPVFTSAEQARIQTEFDMVAILRNRQPDRRRERLSRRGPRKV